jgi:hypothetical protein
MAVDDENRGFVERRAVVRGGGMAERVFDAQLRHGIDMAAAARCPVSHATSDGRASAGRSSAMRHASTAAAGYARDCLMRSKRSCPACAMRRAPAAVATHAAPVFGAGPVCTPSTPSACAGGIR